MRITHLSFMLIIGIFTGTSIGQDAGAPSSNNDEDALLLQDFEGAYAPSKYPGDKPGVVTVSTDWKADGLKSLRIDAGLMTVVEEMKTKNWNGYSLLRIHVMNPQTLAATVGFELSDSLSVGYWDRHQNAFGVEPGEHVVDLDFSGGLCRSETNRPYRGSVKTPIDLKNITRMAFINDTPGQIYIDKIELVKVKKLQTPGGFAFDFGKSGKQVMGQFIGVLESTAYTTEKGWGMMGATPPGVTPMSYPTPMLGSGLALPAQGFRVDLPGGEYLGWIAFERGGFWEGEYCSYSHAALKVNGSVVHEHDFSPAGIHFLFEDTEISDISEIADKLIWPAQAISSFKFAAVKGANVFTLDTTNASHMPLRVAGLVLAPNTSEGKAFIAAHEQLQRKVIATTFAAEDRSRRSTGRAEPLKTLVYEPLAPGESVYPRDWPSAPAGASLPVTYGLVGQTVTLNIGVYAKKKLSLVAAGGELKGLDNEALPLPTFSHGRYLPCRPYGTGTAWLAISHYRPDARFTVGPELARSIVAEYEIPLDAKPGTYTGAIKISGDGEQLSIPVELKILSVKLPEIPIPVGLFANTLSIGPDEMDTGTWWKLQEELMREQMRAGLNILTGGPGISYNIDSSGKISGDNAVKLVKIAQRYGTVKAVVPYGGFLPNLPNIQADFKAVADGLNDFEASNQLPPTYVNSYDEPATEAEKKNVLKSLARATDAGLKTVGWTSFHPNDPLWDKIIQASYAPALNFHDSEDLRRIKALGRHPWIYNNGASRYGFGLNLWRSIKLGAEGRLNWIGMITQGFAFNNLDGREPSYGCFLVHNTLGVLKTPTWMSAREGLLDLRLRLALEQLAPSDDPVLKLWNIAGYRDHEKYAGDSEKWTDTDLQNVRVAILKRLEELCRK